MKNETEKTTILAQRMMSAISSRLAKEISDYSKAERPQVKNNIAYFERHNTTEVCKRLIDVAKSWNVILHTATDEDPEDTRLTKERTLRTTKSNAEIDGRHKSIKE